MAVSGDIVPDLWMTEAGGNVLWPDTMWRAWLVAGVMAVTAGWAATNLRKNCAHDVASSSSAAQAGTCCPCCATPARSSLGLPATVAGLHRVHDLLFAIGLSLAGVFELGTSAGLGRLGNLAPRASGYTGSALNGVLATIVATPCTAPFMGAALGFALTLSAVGSL
jgi:hypothetical protein